MNPVKDEFQSALCLLQTLCDRIISQSVLDPQDPWHGGVKCNLDLMIEPRGSETCYAMAYLYERTSEQRYLDCAVAMVKFLLRQQTAAGWWLNEGTSTWKGTTVFKVMALEEAYFLLQTHEPELRTAVKDAISRAIGYLTKAFDPKRHNINYLLTMAPVLWMAGEILGREDLKTDAAAYGRLLTSHVNDDGLLIGEGHRARPDSIVDPVDVAYNLGVSLGALAVYASKAEDGDLLDQVLQTALTHLTLVYPDGSIDNSWGSRSYKWTMSGSKTDYGAAFTFLMFAQLEPVFSEAAKRHLSLMTTLTRNGALGFGPHFYKNPFYADSCIHIACSRACGLASGLINTIAKNDRKTGATASGLPCDQGSWSKQLQTVNVLIHRSHRLMATVSGSGYANSDASFVPTIPSGGNISYLWDEKFGPVQVGSQYNYQRIEPGSMPETSDPRGCLTPRIECYTQNRVLFSNIFERQTKIVRLDDYELSCDGLLKNIRGQDCGLGYRIHYVFHSNGLTKYYTFSGAERHWIFVREPIVFDPDIYSCEHHGNKLTVSTPSALLRMTSSNPFRLGKQNRDTLVWCPFPAVYALDLRIECPTAELSVNFEFADAPEQPA